MPQGKIHHSSNLGCVVKINTWISLREFTERALAESEMKGLDAHSLTLLEWVAVTCSKSSDPLYIQSLVMQSGVASPATVYKCIDRLERDGLLDIRVDTQDSRRRIVSLSKQAIRAFEKLSKGADHWAKTVRA